MRLPTMTMPVLEPVCRPDLVHPALTRSPAQPLACYARAAAHDIKNVFGSLLLYTGLLEDRMSEPGDRELLADVRRSVEQGMRTVREVMNVAEDWDSKEVAVDLRRVLVELRAHAPRELDERVTLTTSLPVEACTVRCRLGALYRGVSLLCAAASRRLPRGGTIVLKVDRTMSSGFATKETFLTVAAFAEDIDSENVRELLEGSSGGVEAVSLQTAVEDWEGVRAWCRGSEALWRVRLPAA